MKELKPSHILAAVAWAFTFMVGTNIVMRKIPADLFSWGMFLLFFLVAVMASGVAQGRTKQPTIKDLRVNIGSFIFTQESGEVGVYFGKNGAVVVFLHIKDSAVMESLNNYKRRQLPPIPDDGTIKGKK